MLTQTVIAGLVADNFADDIALPAGVEEWSEADLQLFLESGGVTFPSKADSVTEVLADEVDVPAAAVTDAPEFDQENQNDNVPSPPLPQKIGGFFSRLFGKKSPQQQAS